MPDNFRLHTRPTPVWERRLIAAARRGDADAQARLLRQYDPLVQRLAHTFYLPGSEREDLAQEARVGIIIEAVRGWDPRCGVPFSAFAFLCATRETRMAVYSARAKKHEVLTMATRLDAATTSGAGVDGPHVAESLGIAARRRRRAGAGAMERAASRDHDPMVKALAREELRGVVARMDRLSPLERQSIALATDGCSHREIADTLHVGERAVNNALQRARHKLKEPVAA